MREAETRWYILIERVLNFCWWIASLWMLSLIRDWKKYVKTFFHRIQRSVVEYNSQRHYNILLELFRFFISICVTANLLEVFESKPCNCQLTSSAITPAWAISTRLSTGHKIQKKKLTELFGQTLQDVILFKKPKLRPHDNIQLS